MLKQKLVWLATGLVVGLVVGGFLPHAPLHAVATDRQENFAIATCPIDEDQEAVVFLDSTTGDLKATLFNVILNPPGIGVIYSRNVLSDLQVDAGKAKFLLVTGRLQLRPMGNLMYGGSMIYVAEVNSGKVAAYAMPYNKLALQNANGAQGEFRLVYAGSFREAVVR